MSKTSPVRWWRDDATRYQPRGAAEARKELPEEPPQWLLDRLTPTPEQLAMYAEHDRMFREATRSFAMPETLLRGGSGSKGLASGEALDHHHQRELLRSGRR